jgi:WD40 repeat protein
VTTVDFSNDGRLVLSAGEDGKATVWRVADGEALASMRHGSAIRAALSGDGQWVVTAGGDVVRTWTARGRALRTVRHDDVTSVALSPSGRFVATGSEDGSARVWNLRDGRLIRTLAGHTGPVVALQFSPEGTRVATASGDATARVWMLASGTSRVLTGHQEALTSISWSRDGRRVVAPTIDGQVRSWWVRGKGEDVGFRGHVSFVGDARFSPDGRWIVTAGPSAVGLFVAATGRRTYFLRGPTGNLTHAIFTANSRRIVASSNDGTVSTYLCSECAPLAELRRLAKRRLDQIVRVGFGS